MGVAALASENIETVVDTNGPLGAVEPDFVASGQTGGFWFRLRQKPVTTLAACVAIVFIAALSLLPFVRIG